MSSMARHSPASPGITGVESTGRDLGDGIGDFVTLPVTLHGRFLSLVAIPVIARFTGSHAPMAWNYDFSVKLGYRRGDGDEDIWRHIRTVAG